MKSKHIICSAMLALSMGNGFAHELHNLSPTDFSQENTLSVNDVSDKKETLSTYITELKLIGTNQLLDLNEILNNKQHGVYQDIFDNKKIVVLTFNGAEQPIIKSQMNNNGLNYSDYNTFLTDNDLKSYNDQNHHIIDIKDNLKQFDYNQINLSSKQISLIKEHFVNQGLSKEVVDFVEKFFLS
jgi:hypothetical protein